MSISDNIKAIRTQKGIPQAEIARRLEIEPSSYHRLENRGDKLTLEQVERIAQALGVSRLELLTWSDQKQPVIGNNESYNKLKDRVKELEKQVKLYDENRSYKEDIENSTTAIFSYLLDNILWDIAYNYAIISPEEAREYGVLIGDDLMHWKMEDYWEIMTEDGTSYHPYAAELLPEEQLDQALDILFCLIWARDIINQIPNLDWFKERLEKWEAIQNGRFTLNSFYTYKGDYPEIEEKKGNSK